MPRRRKDFALPKSAWGPGPWQNEPDEHRWQHEGLQCYVYRHSQVTGSLNGYVAVPPEHPWWGKDYSECVATPQCEPEKPTDWDAMARDGFPAPPPGSHLRNMMMEPHWSCQHRIDYLLDVHGGVTYGGPMSVIERGEMNGNFSWGFGFDTGHAGDITPAMDATLKMIYLAKPNGLAEWEEHERIMKDGPLGATYKTFEYVKAETERLAEQLAMARNVNWQQLREGTQDEIPPEDQKGSRARDPRTVAAARYA